MLTDDNTREYLKRQPATLPSDIGYYQNAINTRQYTLTNLNNYVKLSSALNTTGWIGSLLTDNTRAATFYLQSGQSLVNKTLLQCEYLVDMWVKKWSLICSSAGHTWFCKFQWQASHDNVAWISIGDNIQSEKIVIGKGIHDEKNVVEWLFTNPENPAIGEEEKKYKYWRVYCSQGTSSNGWIDMMLMNVL